MLDKIKSTYIKADEAVKEALAVRLQANIDFYKAVLKSKGIEPEQTVKIVDSSGKEQIGEFVIFDAQDTAVIRFYPYKKDGVLSKNPRAFNFGHGQNIRWSDEIVSVEASEPPVVEE